MKDTVSIAFPINWLMQISSIRMYEKKKESMQLLSRQDADKRKFAAITQLTSHQFKSTQPIGI